MTTLAERLAQIEVREAELEAQGYMVFALVKDLDYWAQFGVTTAEEFDEQMRLEEEKEARKAAFYYDDFDFEDHCRYLDECNAKWEEEQRVKAEEKADYEAHQVFANYQDGWI